MNGLIGAGSNRQRPRQPVGEKGRPLKQFCAPDKGASARVYGAIKARIVEKSAKAMNKKDEHMEEEFLWQPHAAYFREESIPARTLLLREGDFSRRAFYIIEGCIRTWVNKDGREITCQFFFEGQGVSSVESFWSDTPSQMNIETVEPCRLRSIARQDFEQIIETSDAIRRQVEHHIFKRLIHYQHLFLSRIKDSPQERYAALLKEHPEIVRRIPQHYIASYLGVSAVHLSRIRQQLLPKK